MKHLRLKQGSQDLCGSTQFRSSIYFFAQDDVRLELQPMNTVGSFPARGGPRWLEWNNNHDFRSHQHTQASPEVRGTRVKFGRTEACIGGTTHISYYE
jgi:hypothetical protein